jgi:hypothetical protein
MRFVGGVKRSKHYGNKYLCLLSLNMVDKEPYFEIISFSFLQRRFSNWGLCKNPVAANQSPNK